MAKHSAIEWTEATWNPWHGCKKISPGCKFCYMFREKRRYGQNPAHVVRSKTTFKDPLKWPHEPIDCFTCSWSDFFIEATDEWRAEAWAIMKATPWVRYLVLSKRTDRILAHLPADWGDGYPNVMLGASVENEEYRWRLEQLLSVPCIAGHFASLEPLLGPVILCPYLQPRIFAPRRSGLAWVIVGGESGEANEEVRPMHPQWAREIRDECVAAGVPFFFKQWGEWLPSDRPFVAADVSLREQGIRTASFIFQPTGEAPKKLNDRAIRDAMTGRNGQGFYRVGKIAAGRQLDGREWNEKPARIDVDQLKFEEVRA